MERPNDGSLLQAISLLLGHHDMEVSEAAMDVMLEYATKKGSMNLSVSVQAWTHRLRSIVTLSCRTQVRSPCFICKPSALKVLTNKL